MNESSYHPEFGEYGTKHDGEVLFNNGFESTLLAVIDAELENYLGDEEVVGDVSKKELEKIFIAQAKEEYKMQMILLNPDEPVTELSHEKETKIFNDVKNEIITRINMYFDPSNQPIDYSLFN